MAKEKTVVSEIVGIGKDAYMENHPVLILFDETVSDGLSEVSIIHAFKSTYPDNFLRIGSRIRFNETEYVIEDLGDLANITLKQLGHISLYFEKVFDNKVMPSAALLSPSDKPQLKIGDRITFVQ